MAFVSGALVGCDVSSCTSSSTSLWLYCKKQWSCDHGEYEVKCTPNGSGGMSCDCREGDEAIGSFDTGEACDIGDWNLSDDTVSAECGWELY